MPTRRSEPLTRLPPIFRWSEARAAGLTDPRLYRLLDKGVIERIGHGLYRKADAEDTDLDLIEIAATSPWATLCLTTALARHDLTDEIPSQIDAALPRGHRRPKVRAPVHWHQFNTDTFGLGRNLIPLTDGLQIGLYSPERSIIDAYRLRHLEGAELGRDALRRWLRRRGSQPSSLLRLAAAFPIAATRLRDDLEVLL